MTTAANTCNSCNAPILWAKTAPGKWMPVDPEPHVDGNVRLTMEAGERRAEVIDGFELLLQEDEPRYVSHFATCPDADQHRRKK